MIVDPYSHRHIKVLDPSWHYVDCWVVPQAVMVMYILKGNTDYPPLKDLVYSYLVACISFSFFPSENDYDRKLYFASNNEECILQQFIIYITNKKLPSSHLLYIVDLKHLRQLIVCLRLRVRCLILRAFVAIIID